MKYMLSLCLLFSGSLAAASEPDLTGPQALALFHRLVFQMKIDQKAWLSASRAELAKIRKSSALKKMCLNGRDPKKCALAIDELLPASVFEVRVPRIFQLDEDLKTKYKFDVETGMRVFQLSTGLRWMARKDVYNGVMPPKDANRKTYARFLDSIENFHKTKTLELRKAEPMIPPPAKRYNSAENFSTDDFLIYEEGPSN